MKRFRTRSLLTTGPAIALLAISMVVQAHAETASIQGVVVDHAGQPLPQVPVVVDGGIGSAVTVTNSQGKFALFDLPSGEYSVSAAGATKRVHLEAAKTWWIFGRETRPVFVGLTGINPSSEPHADTFRGFDLITGRAWNIDRVSGTFEVGDMAFFVSRDSTIGVDLYSLEEGDRVTVQFSRRAAMSGTSPILATAIDKPR